MEEDETTPNLIADHVYLSSRRSTQDRAVLDAHNIRYVLNVTSRAGHQWDAITYRQVAIDDSHGITISAYFEECFEFIESARQNGASILVHCEYGISRSATIVLAWLIKHKGMTLQEAFLHTKARRRLIMPNEGFLRQLIALETEVHGKTTLQIGRWGELQWIRS